MRCAAADSKWSGIWITFPHSQDDPMDADPIAVLHMDEDGMCIALHTKSDILAKWVL